VRAQRLHVRPTATPRSILETVRHLGYLQLDPTNVVARSHLLVLWSRFGSFNVAHLERLLWKDRSLYESVSYILPAADRPLHELRVRAGRRGEGPWAARINAWVKRNDRLRRDVLTRLAREGPLSITAFEDRAAHGWSSSGWNDDRNVSQMLSFLLRLGHVAIGGRAGGRKVWVRAADWLPPVKPLGPRVAARAAVERALATMGVATLQELRRYRALGRLVTAEALAELEHEGAVRRIQIEGQRGTYFARTSDLRRPPGEPARTTLLSPFDSLIIDRARTESLFGFRYRMEIYVPKNLRQRGFWAMPILHGDRLIGTADPKMDRARRRLEILSLHLDPQAPRDRAIRRAIEDAVDELGAFAGAREVVWPRGAASSYSRR
jgi:uncharacterized protein